MQIKTSVERLTSTEAAISSSAAQNIDVVTTVHASAEQMTATMTEDEPN